MLKLPVEGYLPSAALDNKGTLHVVYEARVNDAARYAIFYVHQKKRRWTRPRRISGGLPYAEAPRLWLRDNTLVVAFQSNDVAAKKVSLYVVRSEDAGNTWDDASG